MSKFSASLIAVFACVIAAAVGAETLQMGTGEYAATFEQAGKPTRGMTQARVEANFGSPSAMKAAVGEPPISSWEYADFVVFFEHDRVIHAVSKR